MKTDSTKLLQDLAAYLLAAPKTPGTVKRAVDMVRKERQYRWVGIYKIERDDFVIVAATGKHPPTYARFPVTQGLCGAAAETGETLIVGDVHKDPRWLPAFWTTQSEMVVPIKSEKDGHVLGLIDAESDKLNSFGDDDRDFLEHVAVLMARKLCTAKKQKHAVVH
ncbi:MAG TPA: GAF domain-containing protein [Chthoniobacterales bacterium]|nr:GAF domain-containing protein [Chthoniobacterales bacterium]